jgi:pimeloyl-ACP methyl ester carboxylesterase
MPILGGLYYFAQGAENFSRPPVILLHGVGGNHLFWPPQIRRLHDQRIFAVDLPGHGKSEGVGYHRINEYAEDIYTLIQSLKLNAVVLVGHSLGSAVALQMAVRFPKKLIGLGLLGAGARPRVAQRILTASSNSNTFPAAVQMLMESSFGPGSNELLREQTAQRILESRPAVLSGDLAACEAFDVTDQLSRISVPTLVLCGAEDKMTPPKYSEFLHRHIANSRFGLIPQCGHMLMLEQPDRVAVLLDDFLNQIPYQPGK